MIGVAIIGTGYMAEIIVNIIKRFKNAKLVAVHNRNEEKGKNFGNKFNVYHYKEIDNLLKNNEIKVVSICTPTVSHYELISKAANAKKNIFCEKPIALSMKEADEIIEIVKKNKIKFMVGHVLRFMPEYTEAKKIIESGKIGNILNIFCERLVTFPKHPGWRAKEEYSKGAALDLQIHDIDYLNYLLGKPISLISAGVYKPNLGGWAHINTILEFPYKIIGAIDSGWLVKGKFPFTVALRIMAEKGTLEWIFRGGESLEERNKKKPMVLFKMDGSIETIKVSPKDGFYKEWKYFIDCIENNKEIANSTLKDSRLALKIALASIESAKIGEKIYL
jgi:predicted dehydrogenase